MNLYPEQRRQMGGRGNGGTAMAVLWPSYAAATARAGHSIQFAWLEKQSC